MNRRKFFGAMIAPLGAIVAVKTLPVGYVESTQTKLKRWFNSDLVHHASIPVLQTRLHMEPIWPVSFSKARMQYQMQLNRYLRERVDQAAFEMMTGDLDGKG